ncbi:MAG: hypothetical protein NTX53_10565 [candidate division WOR-3 bacterium]|nr:hypothetical protein [candidate division WOR-3 bacterium]
MLRLAIENGLIPVKATWADYRLHDLQSPNDENPGPRPERSFVMSDVTRRISRWKAKYSPEIAAQTTARIFADMTERYQASMVALCAI